MDYSCSLYHLFICLIIYHLIRLELWGFIRGSRVLESHNEIANFVSTTGSTAQGMGGGASHEAQIQVSMVPLEQRNVSTSAFIESIERELSRADSDA